MDWDKMEWLNWTFSRLIMTDKRSVALKEKSKRKCKPTESSHTSHEMVHIGSHNIKSRHYVNTYLASHAIYFPDQHYLRFLISELMPLMPASSAAKWPADDTKGRFCEIEKIKPQAEFLRNWMIKVLVKLLWLDKGPELYLFLFTKLDKTYLRKFFEYLPGILFLMAIPCPRALAKIKPEGHYLLALNSASIENHLVPLKRGRTITKKELAAATEFILREFEKVDFYIDPLNPLVPKLTFRRAKSIVQEAKTLEPAGERNDNFFFGKLYLALAVCSIIDLKSRHGPGDKYKEELRHYVDKALDMLEHCAVTVDFLRLMILITEANKYLEKLYECGHLMVSQRRGNFECARHQLGGIAPLLFSVQKSLEDKDLDNLHVTLMVIEACRRSSCDEVFCQGKFCAMEITSEEISMNKKAEDVILQPLKMFLERLSYSDSSGLSGNSSGCTSPDNMDISRPKLLLTKAERDKMSPKCKTPENSFNEVEVLEEEDTELTQKYIDFIRLTDGKLPCCIQLTNMNTKDRKIEIFSSDTDSSEHKQFLKLVNYEEEKEWYVVKQHGRVQRLTLDPLAGLVNIDEISVYERVNPGSAFIAIKRTKVQEAMDSDPKKYINNKNGNSNFWTIGFLGSKGRTDNKIYLVSCAHGFHMLDMKNHTWEYFSVYQPEGTDEQRPSLLKIDQDGLVTYFGKFDKNTIGIPHLIDISLLSLKHGFLGNQNVDLHFRENFQRQGKVIKMEIYSGDMSKLNGKRVCVRGCKSGYFNETAEIINGAVGSMNLDGSHVTGIFSIALVNGQNRVGTHGDSGALIYGVIDNKPVAIGLLYGRDDGHAENAEGERIRATYCVPLQHAQRYLKDKHDIDLCFYYKDNESDSGFSSPTSPTLGAVSRKCFDTDRSKTKTKM